MLHPIFVSDSCLTSRFGGLCRQELQLPNPITVLVVEDEVLVRLSIVDELQDRGFLVLDAGNAAGAIDLLSAHPEISVLFTDVDMPGSMDGLKLAAAVRDRWPPIRIIVTSGHRKVELGDLPKESRFLDKPYAADEVASVVREIVSCAP